MLASLIVHKASIRPAVPDAGPLRSSIGRIAGKLDGIVRIRSIDGGVLLY